MKSVIITLLLFIIPSFLFSQDLYSFSANGKYGLKNSAGQVVVPSRYDMIFPFYAGLAAVNKGGKWEYDYYFEEELYLGGGKWGFIDKKGNEVIPLKYDFAEDFSETSKNAYVELGGEGFLIDTKGNKITDDFTGTGKYKKYYFSNNKLKSEGEEVNGKKKGEWKFYFENGRLYSTANYNAEGKPDGEMRFYHPNGIYLGKEIHKDGRYVKPGDFFDNTGKPTLTNGNGHLVSYHTNGALSVKSFYKNYSRDGETIWFYDNGQVEQKAIYKYTSASPLGLRWEIVSSFDKYGVTREKGTLKNGNGTWISYDANGQRTVTSYQNGLKVEPGQLTSNAKTGAGNNSSAFSKAVDHYIKKEYNQAHDGFVNVVVSENNTEAMAALGDIYYLGQGRAVNYTKAFEWYQKAANLGNTYAIRLTGTCYYLGKGVPVDYKKSMEWYQKAADKGDTSSMLFVGELYYLGQGVTKSFSTAMNWFKKAADKNNATAMRYIGSMYYRGEGVADDFVKAMDWYRKAAAKGDDDAMRSIGGMYYRGEAVTKNFKTALDWYLKAADAGNATAMRLAGTMFANGEGTTKDLYKALNWYQKSVDKDPKNPDAFNALGYGYFYLKNYEKAIETLNNAIKVDPKYANGYDSLGEIYEAKGEKTKAIGYYKKAASMGHENSIKWLKEKGIAVPKN